MHQHWLADGSDRSLGEQHRGAAVRGGLQKPKVTNAQFDEEGRRPFRRKPAPRSAPSPPVDRDGAGQSSSSRVPSSFPSSSPKDPVETAISGFSTTTIDGVNMLLMDVDRMADKWTQYSVNSFAEIEPQECSFDSLVRWTSNGYVQYVSLDTKSYGGLAVAAINGQKKKRVRTLALGLLIVAACKDASTGAFEFPYDRVNHTLGHQNLEAFVNKARGILQMESVEQRPLAPLPLTRMRSRSPRQQSDSSQPNKPMTSPRSRMQFPGDARVVSPASPYINSLFAREAEAVRQAEEAKCRKLQECLHAEEAQCQKLQDSLVATGATC